MRSTLARTCHDPWQLNHAIGRPGPSENVRNCRDRATAGLQHICNFGFLCFVCPIRFTKGNAKMRAIDLAEATTGSLGAASRSQRDRFFRAFVSAALRLDRVAMRDWLRKRLRNRPLAAPVDLTPLHSFGSRHGVIAETIAFEGERCRWRDRAVGTLPPVFAVWSASATTAGGAGCTASPPPRHGASHQRWDVRFSSGLHIH